MERIVIAESTAHTGRVKKGSRLPSDSTRPRVRFFSSRSPSTRPRIIGAMLNFSSRMTKPIRPNTSMT